jgi:NUMOD3 motif-containing protein
MAYHDTMMTTIYALVDPRDHEIRYVGITKRTIEERLSSHIRDSFNAGTGTHKDRWIRRLRRLRLQPYTVSVCQVRQEHWSDAERYWIRYFKDAGCRLTNSTDGGGISPDDMRRLWREHRAAFMKNHFVPSTKGRHHTDETKQRLSEITKQQMSDPAMRAAVSTTHSGKTISASHRQAVSEAQTQRWRDWRASGEVTSEATRQKIREARLGKPLSTAHRAKLSATLSGRSKSAEHRAKIGAAQRGKKRDPDVALKTWRTRRYNLAVERGWVLPILEDAHAVQ